MFFGKLTSTPAYKPKVAPPAGPAGACGARRRYTHVKTSAAMKSPTTSQTTRFSCENGGRA